MHAVNYQVRTYSGHMQNTVTQGLFRKHYEMRVIASICEGWGQGGRYHTRSIVYTPTTTGKHMISMNRSIFLIHEMIP